MNDNKELRLAVLIDADNIPYKNVKEMMEEIAKFGIPSTKRIYGDWTKPTVSGWKNILLENAITPIQQYSYTQGKNATDSAMIIDAMDILYSGKVDGFCIVSSDSDFTRLATRLRESGMKVIGIGEKKTPDPFIVSCDKFIYIEILSKDEDDKSTENKKTATKSKTKNRTKLDKKVLRVIKSSINDIADDDGWAFLGDVGNLVIKKRPEFDARNYGYPKLTPLLKDLNSEFEIDERKTEKSNIKHVFVRNKK
ncbi:NYN domain-containing protein [Marinigracilibium pacificum]|uniref:NYN domain-containing protein n=1 Tax=Marinigracilibium pacificum TaxID=2729599 RepID=A0A848IX64_9BACT|nr:NYN domain-containing protein [Marinigracilibium pacificum]NMM48246.1 NYN domain-containing protein [Marinigracilibium pacificum]